MAKEKPFMEIKPRDIYNSIRRVERRTINIEKHAIATNGKIQAQEKIIETQNKSIGLLWKFMITVVAALLGTGGYKLLT